MRDQPDLSKDEMAHIFIEQEHGTYIRIVTDEMPHIIGSGFPV